MVIVGSPSEAEQLQREREVRLDSPEAVGARQVSVSAYEGLSVEGAEKVAGAAFRGFVSESAGGLPPLAEGERVLGYPTDGVAQVELSGGQRVVFESSSPIAIGGSGGTRVPIDLRLREVGGGFEPVMSPAGVRIPKRLGDGAVLTGSGVSLTPVDQYGSVLAGEGVVDGATVFYGGSEDQQAGVYDLGTLAKPSPEGLDLTTLLFSQRSPGTLYFRVGMPEGARLEGATDGSVGVVKEGVTLATVRPPSARDAEGSEVGVSMSVQGDTIKLAVSRGSGEYLYPIAVDPEVTDPQLATTTGGKRSNWEFKPSNSSFFAGSAVYEGVGKEHLETKGIAEYKETEWAYWGYETKGNSKIFELKAETEAKNKGSKIESFLEFLEPPEGKQESKELLSTELENTEYARRSALPLCAVNSERKQECLPAAGKEKNSVHFQQSATKSPGSNYKFSDVLYQGIVSISEPSGTHSTTGFNTMSPELEFEVENEGKKEIVKRSNVLYGSGGWLSKYGGAVEFIAKDAGIGVSGTKLEYESSVGKWEQLSEHNYLENENGCKGVQCYAEHKEDWTLDPKLPNGEDKIRYRAREAMPGSESLESEGRATVKVDTARPRGIRLNGLPWGNELSERPYELTVEATDGEGSTVPSSGIKSIVLYVEGRVIAKVSNEEPSDVCSVPKGECTARAKYRINGAELGAGHHGIVVEALDNAGNEARLYETISIHHSTPVPLGPGSVDLQSGDYALGATDVSMGSGLTVSRNYSSRDVTQGVEGPLGPEWGMSLSSTESLVEMVDGSVLMTSANGSQSIFASLGEGKFEPPTGDSNLQLTLEENKETKVKLAYYLKNAADGTSVKFTLPSGGTTVWVPTRQEGTVPTDTVTYSYQTVGQHAEYPLPSGSSPYAITTGPDGRLWFVDRGTNKIGKITPTGYVTEYALPSGSAPCAITRGPDENLWFTNCGTGKIGKITTTGIVTEYSLPSGSEPAGIALGPNNNLWFTNRSASKIGQINPTSGSIEEYADGEGKHPEGITAGPDGNLWFTEKSWNVVSKISITGSVTAYTDFLHGGMRPKEIAAGPDGNLWFTVENSPELRKITTSGTFILENWSAGSGQVGITRGPDGNMWITNSAKNTITKVTPTGGRTEYSEPEGSEPWAITEGPEHNLWYTDLKSNKIAMITTSGTVTEPTEALAPVPAKVSCTPMKEGCRALKFQYATETTAKGVESEWGAYNGHLTKVLLTAYNPVSKKMQETTVAEYTYDILGRLRAEWDPRISPALKTVYGYDEEGHLTALAPPGQQPWLFSYGTANGDTGTGRLLSLTRPAVSTALGINPVPTNTEAPKLSTVSPVQGVQLSVSAGSWSNSPVAYDFQWERCTQGGVCTAILGATNHTYVPVAADDEQKLRVQLTALNSGGASSSVWTASSGTVTQIPTYNSQFGNSGGNGQLKTPSAAALDSSGNVWVVDTGNHRVKEFSSTGTYLKQFGTEGTGNGQFKEPQGIAIDPKHNIWVSDKANNNVQEFNEKEEYVRTVSSWKTGIPPFEKTEFVSSPQGIAIDSKNNLWVAEAGRNCLNEFNEKGEHISAVCSWSVLLKEEKLNKPTGVTIDSTGNFWVADTGANRVVEFNSSGTYQRQFGSAGTGAGQFKEPKGIATGPEGDVWVADSLNNRLQKFTANGEYLGVTGSEGAGNGQFKEPRGLVLDSHGSMWITDAANNRGQKFTVPSNESAPPPPTVGSSAVATLEYGVPLTGGAGLPVMSEGEVAKWGQQDIPSEGTAVLPPDSPQGWPAASYVRATAYYLDGKGRVTNVSNPSTAAYGSVSTTEYEEESNDVTRTLTPDNRQSALEAGSSKSVEVATLLSTVNTYASKCSKPGEVTEERESTEFGTRLCETEGPQHMVKYMAGKEQREALARHQTRYFYDEHVPAGEPYSKETYNLLTEKAEFAELANREQVEVRTTKTSYSGQENLGWRLRAPTSVTIDPSGLKLTTTTVYNETTGQIVETRGAAAAGTFTFASKFGESGTEAGKLKSPWGIAVDSKGNLWVADTGNNRIEEFGPEGKYLTKFGETGSEPGKLSEPEGIVIDSKGNLWVADTGNNRIEEFGTEGKYIAAIGSVGSEAGKFKLPAALAFDSKGNLWVADTGNNRVEQFNTENKYVSEFGSAGSEPGKLSEPKGIAIDSEGHIWVSDTGNNRIQEFSTTGAALSRFGTAGAGEGQFNSPKTIGFDNSGDIWVTDGANNRAENFSPNGAYITQVGSAGTEAGRFSLPRGFALDAHGNLWITDSGNNRIEEWSKGANAHDAKIVYYSSEANTEGYTGCGLHPEWAGLICETLPAKQPELAGLPKLPVTTVTYNIWNEPEKTEETFGEGVGSKTRTKTETYDEAGRRKTSETTSTSTEDAALPKVTFEYNKETGVLEKQSTTVEGKEQSIVSEYDHLGRLVKYTDTDNNVAKYKYASAENDNLLEEVTDSSNESKSYQAYTYNETTKAMSRLVDSAAGTFTASYDAEGKMTSEVYPNNMCANYTYNPVGETLSVQYLKTANCSEKEPALWYSDTRVPSVRGETFSQNSTLASETYTYDTAGRLTETQETPAGEGCTTRSYAYDEEANRASLTTRKPGSKSECQTEGGTSEGHNYDEANRLTDTGIAYDPLGNVTKLPAADAEGHELKSTFYVDNAVATQEQNEQKNEYSLDPEGRVRRTITTGKTASKVKSHYDGAGEAVAWTEEEETKKWTRNIPGIDGTLAASETQGETAVLQLHDLQGNIAATIKDKTGETELLSKYNSTEFGVPNNGKEPPKFAWLGAGDITRSLPSGVITYGTTSYVPQTGRALQSQQVEPPGLPGGSGAGAPYTCQEEAWNMQGAARAGTEAPGLEAGREREAWEEALAAAVDPNKLIHLTLSKAEGEVWSLNHASLDVKIADIVVFLGSSITDAGVSVVVAKFSSDEIERWMGDYTALLEGCVYNLQKSKHPQGACRISMPVFELLGLQTKIPNFFLLPEVSWCKGWDGVHVHWCYREDLPGAKTSSGPGWPIIA
jgi:streptogramin lyase